MIPMSETLLLEVAVVSPDAVTSGAAVFTTFVVMGEYVCAQSTPALALLVELVAEEVGTGC